MKYDAQKYAELDKQHVWHHLTNHKNFEPAIYVKGEGMRVTDINGKTYLDAVAGGVSTTSALCAPPVTSSAPSCVNVAPSFRTRIS